MGRELPFAFASSMLVSCTSARQFFRNPDRQFSATPPTTRQFRSATGEAPHRSPRNYPAVCHSSTQWEPLRVRDGYPRGKTSGYYGAEKQNRRATLKVKITKRFCPRAKSTGNTSSTEGGCGRFSLPPIPKFSIFPFW